MSAKWIPQFLELRRLVALDRVPSSPNRTLAARQTSCLAIDPSWIGEAYPSSRTGEGGAVAPFCRLTSKNSEEIQIVSIFTINEACRAPDGIAECHEECQKRSNLICLSERV